MIKQDVSNAILAMIFKMKNVIFMLMIVIHIMLQENVYIVKVDMNYMIKIAILKLMDANGTIVQDVLNAQMDMIFKMKNVIVQLLNAIFIIV